MYKNQTIRRVVSGLLLCFFTFSATPKKWVHDLFANHKDFYTSATGKHVQFVNTGFHCDCDNLIVNTPFLQVDGPKESVSLKLFGSHESFTFADFHTGHSFVFHLRGPPIA